MKKASKIFAWLVVIHSSLFTLFWQTNPAIYTDTNDFLGNMLDIQLDFISLFQVVSALFWGICLGVLLRHVIHYKNVTWNYKLFDWLIPILGVIYLIFFYGSFILLFTESPDQKSRILQLLSYYRIILDPILLLVSAILAAYWIRVKRLDWKRAAPIMVLIVIFCSLALAFPPDSVIRGRLPGKPLLVAHRGASALAPENTLAAAQKAADLGVFGQETDVQISADGQLFLMHDDTLTRTIIGQGVGNDPAGSFTWEELKDKDPSVWFIMNDPYGTVKTSHDYEETQWILQFLNQTIPTFQDWLGILEDSGQTFIYDVKSTRDIPNDQPFVYEAALKTIAEAGVEDQAWILAVPDQISLVKRILPNAKLAVGIEGGEIPAGKDLVDAGYQVVNADYYLPVRDIRDYQASGLWINIYTVDETWQYSRLWILGVDSVTTNNLTGLISLKNPVFSVPYIIYALLLVVAGVIAIGINRLLERVPGK